MAVAAVTKLSLSSHETMLSIGCHWEVCESQTVRSIDLLNSLWMGHNNQSITPTHHLLIVIGIYHFILGLYLRNDQRNQLEICPNLDIFLGIGNMSLIFLSVDSDILPCSVTIRKRESDILVQCENENLTIYHDPPLCENKNLTIYHDPPLCEHKDLASCHDLLLWESENWIFFHHLYFNLNQYM